MKHIKLKFCYIQFLNIFAQLKHPAYPYCSKGNDLDKFGSKNKFLLLFYSKRNRSDLKECLLLYPRLQVCTSLKKEIIIAMIEVMLTLLLLCNECCVFQFISLFDTMGKSIYSVTHHKSFVLVITKRLLVCVGCCQSFTNAKSCDRKFEEITIKILFLDPTSIMCMV